MFQVRVWLYLFFGVFSIAASGADMIARSEAAFLQKNYVSAFREASKEAKNGSKGAFFLLGLMYSNGLGAPQDHASAAEWFQKAADKGDVASQYELAKMYSSGLGVPEDKLKALKFLSKPAEAGLLPAMYDYGVAYKAGVGGKHDYVMAHKWLNLAASYPEVEPLAPIVQSARLLRSELEGVMTTDQIKEAQSLATAWHKAKKERDEALYKAMDRTGNRSPR